jgi:hypothetical protein
MAEQKSPSTTPEPLQVMLERWLDLVKRGIPTSPEVLCKD